MWRFLCSFFIVNSCKGSAEIHRGNDERTVRSHPDIRITAWGTAPRAWPNLQFNTKLREKAVLTINSEQRRNRVRHWQELLVLEFSLEYPHRGMLKATLRKGNSKQVSKEKLSALVGTSFTMNFEPRGETDRPFVSFTAGHDKATADYIYGAIMQLGGVLVPVLPVERFGEKASWTLGPLQFRVLETREKQLTIQRDSSSEREEFQNGHRFIIREQQSYVMISRFDGVSKSIAGTIEAGPSDEERMTTQLGWTVRSEDVTSP